MHPRLVQLLDEASAANARARLDEVLQLHADGELQEAADQCAAARLLVTSEDGATVALAYELALAAMAEEPGARAVAATAYDRQRRLRGEPQKFGTQVVARGTGFELWPVDVQTTDSERAKWGLPPLAELRRQLTGA